MTRETSIEAYNKIKENGLLSKRRLQVYEILFEHGPMTAGEVFDMGMIRGSWNRAVKGGICARLTELRQVGATKEVGERACKVSKMKTILWDVTKNIPLKFEKPKIKKCPHCKGTGTILEPQQSKLF